MAGILDSISNVRKENNLVETESDLERREPGSDVSFGKSTLQC